MFDIEAVYYRINKADTGELKALNRDIELLSAPLDTHEMRVRIAHLKNAVRKALHRRAWWKAIAKAKR